MNNLKNIRVCQIFFVFLQTKQDEGTQVPFFIATMIEKIKILEIVQDALAGSDKFLVNIKITPDNRIYVDIDGDNGINIDDCIELSRTIESQLDRDEEDFELNVSSAGADAPLKLLRQYKKNVGRDLAVTLYDGNKIEGRLMSAEDEEIVVKSEAGKKAPSVEHHLKYADIKTAKVVIQF